MYDIVLTSDMFMDEVSNTNYGFQVKNLNQELVIYAQVASYDERKCQCCLLVYFGYQRKNKVP